MKILYFRKCQTTPAGTHATQNSNITFIYSLLSSGAEDTLILSRDDQDLMHSSEIKHRSIHDHNRYLLNNLA